MTYLRYFIVIVSVLSFGFSAFAFGVPGEAQVDSGNESTVQIKVEIHSVEISSLLNKKQISEPLECALCTNGRYLKSDAALQMFSDAKTILKLAASKPVSSGCRIERGEASYYHDGLTGNETAYGGERYSPNKKTAAHKSAPYNSQVTVKNLANGKTVVVRINDKGPFVKGRIIDLSRIAAKEIGLLGPGHALVEIRICPGKKTTKT